MESLHIKGFKCLSNHKIKLDKLTILVGGNSVGKSSTVQALLLLRSTLGILRQRGLEINKNTKLPAIGVPLNGDFMLNLGNTTQINSKTSESPDIEIGIEGDKSISVKYGLDDINPEMSISLSNLSVSDSLHPIAFSEGFHYLNAERIGPRAVYDLYAQETENVGWQGEFSLQVLTSKASDIVRVDKRRYFLGVDSTKRKAQASAWLNYIIPGVKFQEKAIHEINKAFITYNDNSPFNVGFGISYVLPIVVAGLIAPENSMLIVENPEAHLHPSGQSRIGRFLAVIAAAGVQVILETHSEHVLNGARIQAAALEGFSPKDIAINFFSKEVDTVQIEQIDLDEEGDLKRFPKGFFDQNQTDLKEIIQRKLNKAKK